MTDINLLFGMQVRAIRESKALTLEQLAERSGLSYSCISKLERGVYAPTLKTIFKVSTGLDISLSDLFLNISDSNRDFIIPLNNEKILIEFIPNKPFITLKTTEFPLNSDNN